MPTESQFREHFKDHIGKPATMTRRHHHMTRDTALAQIEEWESVGWLSDDKMYKEIKDAKECHPGLVELVSHLPERTDPEHIVILERLDSSGGRVVHRMHIAEFAKMYAGADSLSHTDLMNHSKKMGHGQENHLNYLKTKGHLK